MGSASISVAVMQTQQDGRRNHLPLNLIGFRQFSGHKPSGNLLFDALMGAVLATFLIRAKN